MVAQTIGRPLSRPARAFIRRAKWPTSIRAEGLAGEIRPAVVKETLAHEFRVVACCRCCCCCRCRCLCVVIVTKNRPALYAALLRSLCGPATDCQRARRKNCQLRHQAPSASLARLRWWPLRASFKAAVSGQKAAATCEAIIQLVRGLSQATTTTTTTTSGGNNDDWLG